MKVTTVSVAAVVLLIVVAVIEAVPVQRNGMFVIHLSADKIRIYNFVAFAANSKSNRLNTKINNYFFHFHFNFLQIGRNEIDHRH